MFQTKRTYEYIVLEALKNLEILVKIAQLLKNKTVELFQFIQSEKKQEQQISPDRWMWQRHL